MVPRVWIGIRRALLVSRVVVACSRCLFFFSWRPARHFLCSFLLSCACSAVVRACGRFARHVALWASTVLTFATPCAFLSVYRLQLCELFFLLSRDCKVFHFFRSPFAPRPLSVMWRRHGRFSGALFGLQALSDQSATILQAFVANRRSLQPRAVFEREDLLCELVHWMGSAKISARGVASLSIPELLFLTCVCPHTHGPPRAGPEGALRWCVLLIPVVPVVRGRASTPMPPARGLHTLAALPPRQHGQKSQQVSQPPPGRQTRPPPACPRPGHTLAVPPTHLHLVAFHMTLHPQARSFHSHSSLSYRGCPPPTPAPVPARIAAVQSRVAATVVSGPKAPPPTPAFSTLRDQHYWCNKFRERPMPHEAYHHSARLVHRPAPCSWPSSVSPTRRRLVEVFDARARESAIAVARPGQHRLPLLATSTWRAWTPLLAPSTKPALRSPALPLRLTSSREPAARFHSADPLAPGQHLACCDGTKNTFSQTRQEDATRQLGQHPLSG